MAWDSDDGLSSVTSYRNDKPAQLLLSNPPLSPRPLAMANHQSRLARKPAPSALSLQMSNLPLCDSQDGRAETCAHDKLHSPTVETSSTAHTASVLDAHASWLDGWFAHTTAYINAPKTPVPPTATRTFFLSASLTSNVPTLMPQQQRQVTFATSTAPATAKNVPWLANEQPQQPPQGVSLPIPNENSQSQSPCASVSSLSGITNTSLDVARTPATLRSPDVVHDFIDFDDSDYPPQKILTALPPSPSHQHSVQGSKVQQPQRRSARGVKRRRVQASIDSLGGDGSLLQQLSRLPIDFAIGVAPSYRLTTSMVLEPRDADATTTERVPYPDATTLAHICSTPPPSQHAQERRPVDQTCDLYAPHYTRYDGDAREGWCRYCPRPCSSSGSADDVGNSDANWYCIKRSQYMYHLQYVHGISSRTRRPYEAPRQLVVFNDRNKTTAGLCGMCSRWITICFGATRKTSWMSWHKHCNRCHKSRQNGDSGGDGGDRMSMD